MHRTINKLVHFSWESCFEIDLVLNFSFNLCSKFSSPSRNVDKTKTSLIFQVVSDEAVPKEKVTKLAIGKFHQFSLRPV